MIVRRTAARPGRRAFSLVELAIASLMLAIAMTATLHVLGWIAAERRALDRRQCALQEAANLMERLAARPFDDLTAEAAAAVALSEPARRSLPGAELLVTLHDEEDGGRRIALRLRWRSRAGAWEAPVRLSAWSYPRGGHP